MFAAGASNLKGYVDGWNLDGIPAPIGTMARGGSMKLCVTFNSPCARLARIPVLEKALEDRVDVIEAKTRAAPKPSAKANGTFATLPSGNLFAPHQKKTFG